MRSRCRTADIPQEVPGRGDGRAAARKEQAGEEASSTNTFTILWRGQQDLVEGVSPFPLTLLPFDFEIDQNPAGGHPARFRRAFLSPRLAGREHL